MAYLYLTLNLQEVLVYDMRTACHVRHEVQICDTVDRPTKVVGS